MPLDGHSYLVAQGWKGKGSGLRNGSISRPLAIPQKRTLAGLGKDRDEAFPFWDHLFTAAASAIKIKIHDSDDEGSDSGNDSSSKPELKRTSTGILSNRRPVLGTSASSGATTPSTDENASSSTTHSASLVSIAKREAARKALYARLYRGPTLGPELREVVEIEQVASTSKATLDVVDCIALEVTAERPKEKKSKKGKDKQEKGCGTVIEERKEKKRRSKDKVVDGNEKKKREGGAIDTTMSEKLPPAGVEDVANKKLERRFRRERKELKAAGEGMSRDGEQPTLVNSQEENWETKRRKEKKKHEKQESTDNDRDEADASVVSKTSKKRKAEELDGTPVPSATDRSKDREDKKLKKEKKRRREKGDTQ